MVGLEERSGDIGRGRVRKRKGEAEKYKMRANGEVVGGQCRKEEGRAKQLREHERREGVTLDAK